MSDRKIRAMVTKTRRRQGECVVHLFALLVDNIHLVGGVLLPADSFPIGRCVVLVATALALSKTLLYVHGLFIFLIVDNKDKGSVNIASLLWVDC